jgi:hypothetical protein
VWWCKTIRKYLPGANILKREAGGNIFTGKDGVNLQHWTVQNF